MILDYDAPKDLQNKLGWTALHEACFFNRVETVKTLLLAGCRGDLRTRSGALPFHLASLKMVREMLQDMGGPGSVPNRPDDTIDMVAVLRELTSMGLDDGMFLLLIYIRCIGCNLSLAADESPSVVPRQIEASATPPAKLNPSDRAESKRIRTKLVQSSKVEELEDEEKPTQLLHSGGVLGDLPQLTTPKKASPDKVALLKHSKAPIDGASSIMTAEGARLGANGRGSAAKNDLPKDVPPEFVCQLCHRVMSDPVKSVYGHTFEATVINRWFREQGHICPLSGWSSLSKIQSMAIYF